MKTAVVTGATSGIGLATAVKLAGQGIRVIGVGRDAGRCAEAVQSIRAVCGEAVVDYVTGDLSTTSGVRLLAADIRDLLSPDGSTGRLDILVHVAGTVSSWHIDTAEAYELQFAVNHLAPFLLTHELMPCLLASSPHGDENGAARVLAVSSQSHYHTRIRWDDIMMRRHYHNLAAYKQSKLCNVLFIAELARRMPPERLCAYAVDPGLVQTGIGLKGTSGIERLVWRLRMRAGTSPDVPAAEIAALATDPAYAGRSGLYWRKARAKRASQKSGIDPGFPPRKARAKRASRTARDPEQASRLWSLSERLCGIVFRL